MNPEHRPFLFVLLLLIASAKGQAPASRESPPGGEPNPPPASEKPVEESYATKHYHLRTDLPPDQARELTRRLEAMFAYYETLLGGVEATFDRRLGVVVHRRNEDFLQAVGQAYRGCAGVFTGRALHVAADTDCFSETSIRQAMQHEGFHQFLHAGVLRGDRRFPLWLNEGLAEYAAGAFWTGRRLVGGVIDPARLHRIVRRVKGRQFRALRDLLGVTVESWGAEEQLQVVEYDQVWSLVYFLTHGMGARYHRALGAYIRDLAGGKADVGDRFDVFQKHFGGDIDALEEQYQAWWTSQESNPTADLRDRIAVETLANALAALGNDGDDEPDSAETFFQAVRDGAFRSRWSRNPASAFPPGPLDRALQYAARHKHWAFLRDASGQRALILRRDDGIRIEARFSRNTGRPPGDPPPNVTVSLHPPGPPDED
jgi:hypothetical protein